MNISRLVLIAAAMVATVSVGIVTLAPRNESERKAEQPTITQAIADLEQKANANPTDPGGWQTLGMAFSQANRFGESATAFRRAAQLAPQVAENWSNLGEVLVLSSKGNVPPDAKVAFSTAIARDPKDVRARYFLAVSKDIAGDHRAAIDDWIALLRDSPRGAPWETDVLALINRVAGENRIDVADRLAAIGRSAQPADDQSAMIASMVDGLAAKLKQDPKNVEGWIMLMRSYASLGRMSEAQAALVSARAANPIEVQRIDAAAAEMKIVAKAAQR